MAEKIVADVTFDPSKGFVASVDRLAPIIALSLGGIRRKIEAAMMPDAVEIKLELDRAARIERDQRRRGGVMQARDYGGR